MHFLYLFADVFSHFYLFIFLSLFIYACIYLSIYLSMYVFIHLFIFVVSSWWIQCVFSSNIVISTSYHSKMVWRSDGFSRTTCFSRILGPHNLGLTCRFPSCALIDCQEFDMTTIIFDWCNPCFSIWNVGMCHIETFCKFHPGPNFL